jgi:hypothetical protein
MGAYEDFIKKQKPPETLYHYTNRGGLLGILKNKELWATHILYFDDRKELDYAFDKMKAVYTSLRKGKKIIHELNLDLQRNISQLLSNGQMEDFYVFCLTKAYDVLNMWKIYTDRSPGFAFFSTHEF